MKNYFKMGQELELELSPRLQMVHVVSNRLFVSKTFDGILKVYLINAILHFSRATRRIYAKVS